VNEREDFIGRLTGVGFGDAEAERLFDHLSNWGSDKGGSDLVPKALMGTSNERADFIARMEASEFAPTWETIWDLNAAIACLRADLATVERERDRLRKAAVDQNHEIEQILGAALGYPRYCDDPINFPDATEADGVCVGDHVAETLAEEAAARIVTLQSGKGVASPDYEFLYNELADTQRRDRERLDAARDALSRIPDCRRVGAARMIARKALIAITNNGEEK